MSTPLTRTQWPLGWTPSSDANNGNHQGLLRMDNLQLDEDGALCLARGNQTLNGSAFSGYVDRIYSKNINGTDNKWIAIDRASTEIRRSSNNFTSSTLIGSSGGERAAFADCLGQVLITAGSIKKKDNGTTVNDLGIVTPTVGPSVVTHTQPELLLCNDAWSLIEGHNPFVVDPVSYKAFVDPDTLRAIYRMTYASPVDTTNIDTGAANDPSTDTFSFIIQPQDTEQFINIRVEIILDTDPTLGKNYYWLDFPVDLTQSQFRIGLDVFSTLTANRGQFTRQGDNFTLGWDHVTAINFIATAKSEMDILIGEQKFVGGLKGQLWGYYQYAQMDINDNGIYQAKSPLVKTNDVFYVKNGYTTVTPNPTLDTQVTHQWIFRRSVITSIGGLGATHDATLDGTPVLLDKWYRVASITVNTSADDTLSDLDAIEDNITAEEFLQSLRDVTDDIIGMAGLFNERMLYLTKTTILLSDRLNPDAIDTRYTVKAFGDPTERNYWVRVITNAQLCLATSKDLYEISGTLLDLPDGTLDIAIRNVGEQYPPLSVDSAASDGKIFYRSSDGIRVTAGSNSTLISTQLNLLFQGEDRHGYNSFTTAANDTVSYPMAVGRTRLYVSIPTTGNRKLLIFDLIRQTWRSMDTAPLALHVTQTDDVLLGYGDGGDNYIRLFESSTPAWDIEFRTIYDHNGQPRNRKDTFTLKVVSTGGVSVFIAKDGGGFTSLGTASSGTSYFKLDDAGVTLGFRYAIKITGSALASFKLYETTIEYDPRPEQVNYLRLPNNNLGTYSRKRITAFAFVIDTLGGDVTFTPYVDNVAQGTSNVNTAVKLTNVHYFTSETIGTDLGGILSSTGAPFEFYGLNEEETVSEKLPTPTKFLVIPANDYGTPNRKRHTSYKFQIHTRGQDVTFTPRLDGQNHASSVVNTSEKRTVEHFFEVSDIIGIDIGGTLSGTTPFEFYGVIVPQQIEVLPPRLKSLYTPRTNFGVAARKRIRTIPIIIDTGGNDVTFYPIVDDIAITPTTVLNSGRKQTLYHYFTTDVFGTDFGGTLLSDEDHAFEFYGFGQPEQVEVLPVPKKYDQLQPLRFDKIGKFFAFRTRLIMFGATTSIAYKIFDEDQVMNDEDATTPLYSGTFAVVPYSDNVYEVQLPKNINGTMFRIVLGPTADPFHRYDLYAKVSMSGMESNSRWLPTR